MGERVAKGRKMTMFQRLKVSPLVKSLAILAVNWRGFGQIPDSPDEPWSRLVRSTRCWIAI